MTDKERINELFDRIEKLEYRIVYLENIAREYKKDVEIRPVLEWEDLDAEIPNSTTI